MDMMVIQHSQINKCNTALRVNDRSHEIIVISSKISLIKI